MPISRLRLRLAVWFGLTFLLGLLVLDVGFLAYGKYKADTGGVIEVRSKR